LDYRFLSAKSSKASKRRSPAARLPEDRPRAVQRHKQVPCRRALGNRRRFVAL